MRHLVTLVLGLALLAISVRAADRPNIIFFLTDDQRSDFLGCTGHPIIQTPVIDKLASEGVLFENAFVTTSICAASRATLFTGLYERTHGYTFGKPPISPQHVAESYPSQLRKAGYRTGFIGKFGIGVPRGATDQMFDSFVPLNRSPYFHKQPDGSLRHETEVAGDRAIEFLRAATAAGQPFCLSVSFNASHAEDGDKVDHYPYPKAVAHLYEGMEMPPPRHADPKVFASQPEFLQKSMNRDRYFWRWDTPEEYQHNMRNYLRMISGIDGVIGRVQGQLAELGLADNTIIIYMADNGYYAGSRGFAGKWSHYEESQRVPLIIMDPRAAPGDRGKKQSGIALNVDIAPALLSFAGAAIPAGYQGVPLTGDLPREDFFCEHLMENKSIPKWEGVRGARYKYARYFSQEAVFEFLHDLQQDPDEFINLASDPAHRQALEAMRARTDELRDAYQAAKAGTPSVEELIQQAQTQAIAGDLAAAAQSIGSAIDQQPSVILHRTRAEILSRLGRHKRAAADYAAAIKLAGDDAALVANLHQERGVERFYDAQIRGSVADFDAYLKQFPERAPYHWQRGLSLYYAGEFKAGREQFEIHQKVNSRDVENAAWHFLCVARLEGVDKAREQFIPIEGDSRVPMAEVHQLFAGKLEPQAVLAAAEAAGGSEIQQRNHLCYAHLYLGLYFEALGDAEKSLAHIQKAAVDYKMDHYMGKTAQVHWRLRKPKKQPAR